MARKSALTAFAPVAEPSPPSPFGITNEELPGGGMMYSVPQDIPFPDWLGDRRAPDPRTYEFDPSEQNRLRMYLDFLMKKHGVR